MATLDEIKAKIEYADRIYKGTADAMETATSAAARAELYKNEAKALVMPTIIQLSSGSTEDLKHNRIYALNVTSNINLQGLTVEDNATAYIEITFTSGSISFPTSWVWGIDVFDSTLDPPTSPTSIVGTFEAGKTYLVSVHADKLGIIATISYDRK